MNKNRFALLLILIVILLVVDLSTLTVQSSHLDFVWRAKSPRLNIAVGKLATPIINNDLLYVTFFSTGKSETEHTLKVYNLMTGELVGEVTNVGAFNSIGPLTNGTVVLFVNEQEQVITRLNGATPVWSKKIASYIWDVTLDDRNIYIKTSDELIFIDFNGDIIDKIKVGGSRVFVDETKVYIQGEELYKIDKETHKIIYKADYGGVLYLIMQNDKYLFSELGEVIDKNNGKIIKKIPSVDFGVSDDYIVYFDSYNQSLISLNSRDFQIEWQKKMTDFNTFHPLIEKDIVYFYSDSLEALDVRNGKKIWKDTEKDNSVEFILPILSNKDYIVVFMEDAVFQVYKKNVFSN